MTTKRRVAGSISLVILFVCSLCPAQSRRPAPGARSLGGAQQDLAPKVLKNHPIMIEPAGATSSVAESVNDAGQIVGGYTDKNQVGHGFLYDNGTFHNIDFPGALWTEAEGINNAGEVVGTYNDHTNNHGFTLINGTFATFDFPGAAFTQLQGVNDQGWFTGNYGMPDGTFGAFFWNGVTITNISYPGPGGSAAYGINNAGDIVGQYDSNSGTRDGFLYRNGDYSLITLPGVQLSQKIHYVEAIGINNRGDIAGSYIDEKDHFRAFDLKSGTVTTISIVMARGFGVNSGEEVVGYVFAKDGTNRGYAVVAKLPAKVALGSDKNPAKINEAVTFTVTVSGGDAVAAGTISFTHGKTVLGTAPLNNGEAVFTTTFSKAGNFSIVGQYSGDENYFAAKSARVVQVVTH